MFPEIGETQSVAIISESESCCNCPIRTQPPFVPTSLPFPAKEENLDKLVQGRTAIIIAHRLSTLRNADRILVLRDGRVAEQGHHSELVEGEGVYADLWRVQIGH